MQGRMWPIKGLTKAKRLKWGAAQDHMSWAYMKLLRERNKTRKVYDVNPFVEVYKFYDNMYGLWNPSLGGGGDVWMWLVIGPEKALLIDTAFGLGDLKGLVNEITGGMPLIVANTHVGPDHVVGNYQFGTVYCHEYDVPSIQAACKPGAWDNYFDKDGKTSYLVFERKDIPPYKDYKLIPVKDGHVFNLGGDYNVETVWVAGHTPGHVMFLDKKGRYLFTGDDMISDTISCGPGPTRPNGQYSNLTTYRDNLKKLVTRLDEFDHMFSGHFISNVENRVLLAIFDALNEIIADPSQYDYKEVRAAGTSGAGQERMIKFVRGFGVIAYTQNGVYPPKA